MNSSIPTPDTTLTTKGQVTIPTGIRQHLGLKPKDRVRFVVASDGSVRISPAPSRIAEWFGAITPRKKPEDFRALRREFEEGVASDNTNDV